MVDQIVITPLQGAITALSLYLFIHGVCTLNFMTVRTPWFQRMGYVLFTVGAFGVMLSPFFSKHDASIQELLLYLGLVVYNAYRTARLWRAFTRRTNHRKSKAAH